MNTEEPALNRTAKDVRSQWPALDIFLGFALLVALFFVQRFNPFSDDPWKAQAFELAVIVTSLISLVLYSVYSCRKSRLWPMFRKTSLKALGKEFIVSSWYMFVMLLVCGILLLIPALILQPGMNRHEIFTGTGIESDTALTVALLIVVMTLGPFAEELFFRGFLYNALKSRLSIGTAATLQALVFSAFHRYDLFNSLRVFLFGIAFAYIYEKRRTILAPISAHVFVNAVATVPLLFVTAFHLYPGY